MWVTHTGSGDACGVPWELGTGLWRWWEGATCWTALRGATWEQGKRGEQKKGHYQDGSRLPNFTFQVETLSCVEIVGARAP